MTKKQKCIILLSVFFVIFPALSHSQIIESWWNNLDELNGTRFTIKFGGWNFWITNDNEYIYSDLIGSIFSGNEGKLYNFPMFGIGIRWSPWKFIIINGVFSSTRISAGPGIGIPFGNSDFNITPWVAADISFTNGSFPVFSFEGGIDVLLKHPLIIGIEFSYTNNGEWVSIDYGLTFGIKLK